MSDRLAVYATAFRHVTPGEGVGGFEWDFVPGEARKRVDAVVASEEPYEKLDVEVAVPREVAERGNPAVTRYLDAYLWDEWGR